MNQMPEPPDDIGCHGSSHSRDDPRWLFAPDLLNAPDIRDRLEKPRRQLDSYALYISSHIELAGEYVEPSPSPSPPLQAQVSPLDVNEDIQMLSPIEEHEASYSYQKATFTNLEESSSIPLQSIEPVSPCHTLETSISAKISAKTKSETVPRSPTWATENDQLPTPTSISRSSTLVDGERQLIEDFIIESKRQKSKHYKAKTQQRDNGTKMARVPRKDNKVVKRSIPQASTHSMVTRSKSRHNYGALG